MKKLTARKFIIHFFYSVILINFFTSCLNRDLVKIEPITESYILQEVPIHNFSKVDILVIVDNSGSMAEEQKMLKDAFPNLIKDLLDPPVDPVTGERVHKIVRDMHIGVVSTDLGVGGYEKVPSCETKKDYGDDAVLQHIPRTHDDDPEINSFLQTCNNSYDSYLHYNIPAGAEPDSSAVNTFAHDFGCIALLGTKGCGFEQQLEAARRALYEKSLPGAENYGFLRNDSILTILIVSDEEDCSAEDKTIFDLSGVSENEYNLVCYNNKSKLYSIDRYVDSFKKLRCQEGETCVETPENLVFAFIVGVPPGSICENSGDNITNGCLSHPSMVEKINEKRDNLELVCKFKAGCDPLSGEDCNSCTPGIDCSTEAYPGIRYVQLAQKIGHNAVVRSICTNTFVPAVKALMDKLQEVIGKQEIHRTLEIHKDPENSCRCVSSCTIVEALSDNRTCPPDKSAYDGNGDTIGDTIKDTQTNQERTLCEIPQAGSLTSRCDLPCENPEATFSKFPDKEGWWYNPYEQTTSGKLPTVHFEDILPEEGSNVSIQCQTVVCPQIRQCGKESTPDAKCCDINEYCFFPDEEFRKSNEGYCLIREDICEQFGQNTWCPGAQPLSIEPSLIQSFIETIGGLCCVDPNVDGYLDMVDTDEDGLPDSPQYECQNGRCVKVR